MIDSQWRNVCTVVTSVMLMLFVMAQIVLALALNLKSETWSLTSSDLIPEKTRITTGIIILIDALFIFPATWTGICAAVSRHRGVYIALVVIAALAFLGEIGALVDIAWEFGALRLFVDSGSDNDEIAITLLVFQSLIIVITLGLLIFGIIALLYECPKDGHNRHGSKEQLVGRPAYPTTVANYSKPAAYPAAYPSAAAYGPSAAAYPSAAAPVRPYNTLGDYRPLTRGAPEWDRFYEQYFESGKGNGDDYRRKDRHRSNSYRY